MKEIRMDITKTREAQEEMNEEMKKISECMDKLCSDNSPVFTPSNKTSNWKVHL